MSRSTALHRRLADGLYGRMEFDFACNRGHGFGEAHLHGVLMEILASNSTSRSSRIEPSHPVAAIQRARVDDGAVVSTQGRKREVDFAVFHRDTAADELRLTYCIEAKWAGSSHANPNSILKDLGRLALIHQENRDTACLFLMAGGKDDMARKLDGLRRVSSGANLSPLADRVSATPHRFNMVSTARRRQDPLAPAARRALAETFERIPSQIRTQLSKPGHQDPPNWRVHVWRVTAPIAT